MLVYALVNKDGEVVGSTKGNPTGLLKDKQAADKAFNALAEDKREGVVVQPFRLSKTVVL
jgi:uncharacterized protein GlcG (DUF336 family)